MLIMIADDHADNRELLQRRLVRRGFQVLEASDGEQAVALWRVHGPGVILMDLSMPVKSGLEATREIRADASGREQPVIIALTAHAMASARLDCLAAGCDGFATKPVDFSALLMDIARLCPQAAALAR